MTLDALIAKLEELRSQLGGEVGVLINGCFITEVRPESINTTEVYTTTVVNIHG